MRGVMSKLARSRIAADEYGSFPPMRMLTESCDRESIDNLRDRVILRRAQLAGFCRWLFVRLDSRNAENAVTGVDEEHFPGDSRREIRSQPDGDSTDIIQVDVTA